MASIILDAGHGGYDNGASYQERREKDDTLNMVLAIGDILQTEGWDVMYTRTEDIYQSPWEKVGIANESGADLLVSIHRNSSPSPGQYTGVQTLVYEDEGIPGELAVNINAALEQVGFQNLGTSVRKNLPIIREPVMPAVLVEVGFINTQQDNQLFDERFQDIARAIADGIIQTYREEPVISDDSLPDGDIQATDEESRGLYSIEVGIFGHPENAEGLAYHMQEDGYDCYIDRRGNFYAVCQGEYASMESAKQGEKQLYADGYETRIVPFFRKNYKWQG